MTKHGLVSEFIELASIYENEECLIWPFGRIGQKYGSVVKNRKTLLAHRIVCENAHGKPPSSSHMAAHSCGNGHLGCVNQKHLSWKTAKENSEDAIAHGTTLRGRRQPGAKLFPEDIEYIRANKGKVFQRDLAEMFGIHQSQVSHIQSGKAWGWLPFVGVPVVINP